MAFALVLREPQDDTPPFDLIVIGCWGIFIGSSVVWRLPVQRLHGGGKFSYFVRRTPGILGSLVDEKLPTLQKAH